MYPCDLLTSFYTFQELICQIKIEWQAPLLLPRWSLGFHDYYMIISHLQVTTWWILVFCNCRLPYDPSNLHQALNTFVQAKLALTSWVMFDCHFNMQLTHVPNKVNSHNLGCFFILWLYTMEYSTYGSRANTRRNDTMTHSHFQTHSFTLFTIVCNSLMFHVKLAFINWAFSWFFDSLPWNTTTYRSSTNTKHFLFASYKFESVNVYIYKGLHRKPCGWWISFSHAHRMQ